MRLGLARQVPTSSTENDVRDALESASWMTGVAMNFMAVDMLGNVEYILQSNVPIQGVSEPEPGEALGDLDGACNDQRWQGFHPWDQLPLIGPVQPSSAEAWICNNASVMFSRSSPTPSPSGFIAPGRDLANYPTTNPPWYMADPAKWAGSTWRQRRAREMFALPADLSGSSVDDNKALDQRQTWMYHMWPFFERVVGDPTANPPTSLRNVSSAVALFRNWINARADDFVAHPLSEVTPWTTLLQEYYQQTYLALGGDPTRGFGLWAGEPVFDAPDPEVLAGDDGIGHEPNEQRVIRAMWASLERLANPDAENQVADSLCEFVVCDPDPIDPDCTDCTPCETGIWSKWVVGIDPLANHDTLSEWSLGIDMPFSNPWGTLSGDPSKLYWGHVNVLSLTPHALRLGSSLSDNCYLEGPLGDDENAIKVAIQAQPDLGGGRLAGVPGVQDGPTLDKYQIPFFQAHDVVAAPIGGVSGSIFKKAALPDGRAALLRFGDGPPNQEWMYYLGVFNGAAVAFSVELVEDGSGNPSANARFMPLYGGTEIVPGFTVSGALPAQSQFAPTGLFVQGTWSVLETEKAVLEGQNAGFITLTYL
jgi:hypothetical protein